MLRPACPAFGFLIVAAHCAFQDFVQLFLPLFLFHVGLLDLRLEGLRLAVLVILGQQIHEVGDVAGGQAQCLDFGEFGVGRHVGDALPQLGEGAVDALSPAPLLAVGGASALHRARPPQARRPRTGRHSPIMGVVQAGGAAGILRAVGQGHAVVGGRHLRVANKPAVEVRVLLVAAAAGGGGGSGCGGGGSGWDGGRARGDGRRRERL